MSNDANILSPLRKFRDRCSFAAFIALIYCLCIYDKEIRDSFFWMGSYFMHYILPVLIGIGITLLITQKNARRLGKRNKTLNFLNFIFLFFLITQTTSVICIQIFLQILKLFLKSIPTISSLICYLVIFTTFFLCNLGYLQIIWTRSQKMCDLARIPKQPKE